MEIVNINNQAPEKAKELGETAKTRRAGAINAYANVGQTDSVDVSSKAKLLHKLREKYDTLPGTADKVEGLRAKVDQPEVLKFTPEEIVSGILKGTIFEVL